MVYQVYLKCCGIICLLCRKVQHVAVLLGIALCFTDACRHSTELCRLPAVHYRWIWGASSQKGNLSKPEWRYRSQISMLRVIHKNQLIMKRIYQNKWNSFANAVIRFRSLVFRSFCHTSLSAFGSFKSICHIPNVTFLNIFHLGSGHE